MSFWSCIKSTNNKQNKYDSASQYWRGLSEGSEYLGDGEEVVYREVWCGAVAEVEVVVCRKEVDELGKKRREEQVWMGEGVRMGEGDP